MITTYTYTTETHDPHSHNIYLSNEISLLKYCTKGEYKIATLYYYDANRNIISSEIAYNINYILEIMISIIKTYIVLKLNTSFSQYTKHAYNLHDSNVIFLAHAHYATFTRTTRYQC